MVLNMLVQDGTLKSKVSLFNRLQSYLKVVREGLKLFPNFAQYWVSSIILGPISAIKQGGGLWCILQGFHRVLGQ